MHSTNSIDLFNVETDKAFYNILKESSNKFYNSIIRFYSNFLSPIKYLKVSLNIMIKNLIAKFVSDDEIQF